MQPKSAANSATPADHLLVGALAAATTLTPALLILAALLTTTAAIVAAPTKHPQHPTRGDSNV